MWDFGRIGGSSRLREFADPHRMQSCLVVKPMRTRRCDPPARPAGQSTPASWPKLNLTWVAANPPRAAWVGISQNSDQNMQGESCKLRLDSAAQS